MNSKIKFVNVTNRLEQAIKAFVATLRDFGYEVDKADEWGFTMELDSDSYNACHLKIEFRSSVQTGNSRRDHMSIYPYTYNGENDKIELNAIQSIYNRTAARIVGTILGQLSLFPAGLPEKHQPGHSLWRS